MPTTKEIALYTFDELDYDAKQRARDWYRNGSIPDDLDFCIDDFAEVCNRLGITLNTKTVHLMSGNTRQKPNVSWSIGSYDDYFIFSGSYAYRARCARSIKTWAPQDKDLHAIVDALVALQKVDFYGLTCRIRAERTTVTVIAEHDTHDIDETQDALQDIMRDLCSWQLRQMQRDVEYQNSDEVVDEIIRCNEYEFDEDGDRV